MHIRTISSLNFGAGKTILFSDFDGTFMSVKHEDLKQNSQLIDRKAFNDTYDKFRKFQTSMGDNFEFNVTSGRNLYEWLFFVKTLETMGLKTPLPNKVISTNGGDVFAKTPTNNYIPATPIEKSKAVQKASGWDDNVRKDLMKIFQDEGYKIIEPLINSSEREYNKSTTIQRFFPSDSKEKFAAFRKNDNLLLNIALNNRNVTTEDETEKMTKKIKAYFEKRGISAKVKNEYDTTLAGGYPIINVIPVQDGKKLTKVYDPKLALEKAKRENDMVITAGDGSNDKEMLNPLNYMDIPKLDNDDLNEIKKYFKNNPEKLKELKRLPFAGIICTGNPANQVSNYDKEKLPLSKEFVELINDLAGSKKLFVVQRGKLQDGIEEAIATYSEINKNFEEKIKKETMSKDEEQKIFMALDDKVLIGPQPGKRLHAKIADPKKLSKDMEFLKKRGVTDIIDLRCVKHESQQALDDERKAANAKGINWHSMEQVGEICPTDEHTDKMFDIVKNAKGKVYLHCYAGRDRTGNMAAMYLAYTQGRNMDEITKLIYHSRKLDQWKYIGNGDHNAEMMALENKLKRLANDGAQRHFVL